MTTVLNVTLNETRKGLLLLWTYRINALVGLMTIGITFLGVSFLITEGDFTGDVVGSMLLGYLVWFYIILVTSNMGEALMEEAQTGTLEQMFISPVPIGFILIGRTLANLLSSTLQIALVGGVMIALLGVPIRWSVDALPVFALTIMGLFGLGFLLGGLTLIFKQAAAMANLANNVLIFLNGALVPIDRFPMWLQAVSKTLPGTQGIVVLRAIMIEGRTLAETWNDGSLILLIVHSAVYFVGGWLVLMLCERHARRQGSLGQY